MGGLMFRPENVSTYTQCKHILYQLRHAIIHAYDLAMLNARLALLETTYI